VRALVAGALLVALVLCAGCQGMAASTRPPTGQVTSGSSGQGNAELDQIQSTLDSVSARLDADSGP
jgi:hypothetical protein